MKFFLFLGTIFFSHFSYGQQNLGIFEETTDIGNPKLRGAANYDPATQMYSLKGSGYNIWFERDEFRYLFKKIKGDFIATANFEFVGAKGNGHRKYGWMLRKSIEDDAIHYSGVVHGDGLTVLQWRKLKGAFMRDPEDEIFFPKKGSSVIQLERLGNQVTLRVAHPGEPLQEVGTQEMEDVGEEVLIGVFIGSHDATKVEEARVWNVRIDQPLPHMSPGGQGINLGCRLETLDVFDGKRKVIYESRERFEAPNWMPDGKKLLFNMGGLLYKIPVGGGDLEKLNTGSVTRNNNDHGISFDGKWLAISSQREGMPGGGSTVYVLPLEGGEPKLVTKETPSYWHGWAPNGKEVVVVAQRDGSQIYNLYKVSIHDGREVPLTQNTEGHVDGCEYSPDGKYIYFNGNQSGTMQIWRMKSDGSGKEQLTFDEYNDWFPHISPDGKWIAFISFSKDIEVNAHPSYKRVTLRLMPVSGGAPRVIAYLYGGQGTINVPSWSPDSRRIAFVSNAGFQPKE